MGENFGGFGERNAIRQCFTQPNSRFTTVANVSYCKIANILPRQNPETIDPPKFYPAKILHYAVLGIGKVSFCVLEGNQVGGLTITDEYSASACSYV